MQAPVLILASTNAGKAREFRQRLSALEIKTLGDLAQKIEMPPENGKTFAANAAQKAEHVARILSLPVIADDSGLSVDALDGAPGIHSARYAPGTDANRNAKLIGALVGVQDRKRTARFVCAMALAAPGIETVVVRGTIEGRIGLSPQGENGFGYDPLFFPHNRQVTMAELTMEEKNEISHRGQAISAMIPHLRQHFSLE